MATTRILRLEPSGSLRWNGTADGEVESLENPLRLRRSMRERYGKLPGGVNTKSQEKGPKKAEKWGSTINEKQNRHSVQTLFPIRGDMDLQVGFERCAASGAAAQNMGGKPVVVVRRGQTPQTGSL